ncbi:MAG: YIP1 family protein [Caldilineales bacterium]|nr:YIP1 family protein [Caldilineales bacterium]
MTTNQYQSTLSSWWALTRDTLTLKPDPYLRMVSGKPSLRRALIVVAIVGLLIGAVQAVVGLPSLVVGNPFNAEDFVSQMEQSFNQIAPFMGDDPNAQQFMDIYRGSLENFAPFIEQVTNVRTPLPKFIDRLFMWVGEWLSTPFALLARWLGISIWIMLFARLLGGRGGLLAYLSVSALSTIPHLLGALGFIPCVGWLLALIGSIWGLIIQVKAVEVSHDLSQGRAIAAVLLPYILIVVLIGLLAGIGIALLFAAIASSN